MSDISLRELQERQPWRDTYSQAFKESRIPHKNFAHALTHLSKAAGQLSAIVDDGDHESPLAYFPKEDVEKFVADLVVCAIRMANTNPTGVIDLQKAVLDRIAQKAGVKL